MSVGLIVNMSPTLHYGSIDLYIEKTDLAFNPASPMVLGENVSIEAVVHLTGGLDEIVWTKQGVSLNIGPNPDYNEVHVISPRILIENGTYKMWYSSSDGLHYHIAYATSADGISWTKHGMVLDIGNPGEPDDTHVAYHWIVKEGSLYKMWYSGLDEYTPDGGIYRIFYATSADGLSWTKHGVVVDADPPGGAGYPLTNRPCVLNENGTYKMWYSGLDQSGIRRILYATSPDGLSWTKHGVVFDVGPPGSLEETGVTTPFVVRQGGRYLMWYAGLKGSEGRMFLATSMDGLSWTREGLVLDLGAPGSDDDVRLTEPFIEFSGGVPRQMWYAARGTNFRILRATASPDPIETITSVSFYLDGVNPSDEIGRVDNVTVPHDGSATASVAWIAGPVGIHTICAQVDPDDILSETSEGNNTACRELEVITSGPRPPVADAGPDQTVMEGDLVQFDGSGSRSGRFDIELSDPVRVNSMTNGTQMAWAVAVTSEGHVLVSWIDGRVPGHHDVYFAKSTDGGLTFTEKKVADEPNRYGYPRFVRMVLDPQENVYLVWRNLTGPGHNNTIALTRSLDGGETFEDIRRVNEPYFAPRSVPGIAFGDADTVYISWHEPSPEHGGSQVCVVKSVDSGHTFGPCVVANTPTNHASWGTYHMTALATGPEGNVYVTWYSTWLTPGDNNIYLSRSTDGGSTFGPEIRVNDGSTGDEYWPDMATGPEGNVYIAWSDSRNATPTCLRSCDIYFARSTDQGQTFEPNVRVNDNSSQLEYGFPTLALDAQGDPYVGWVDWDSPVMFVDRSLDNGLTFEKDLKLLENWTNETIYLPSLAISSEGAIHFVWNVGDPGYLIWDVYYSRSLALHGNLSFEWDFDEGTDGDGNGNYTDDVDATGPTPTHTYGDDGTYDVTLTVTDEEGLQDTDLVQITVLNVDPEVSNVSYEVFRNVPRTQGYWNFQCTEKLPSLDHVGIQQEFIDYISSYSRVFSGISTRDEVCGYLGTLDNSNMTQKAIQQLMALWLNVASDKVNLSSEMFVPQLNTTINLWELMEWIEDTILNDDETNMETAKDLADAINNGNLVPHAVVAFWGTATDPGSDDLKFTWDWEDGILTEHLYFNDGIGPDPYPSPDVHPMTIADAAMHSYASAGSYVVTLTVTDDDGGASHSSNTLDIG